MSPTEMYAQHRSWRCWLSLEEPGAPLLELVWQISPMVPRVLLQVGRAVDGQAPESRTSNQPTGPMGSPSGHAYQIGLSSGLSELADAVLSEWSKEGTPEVRLQQAGSDKDTSEFIMRRALDLVRFVVDSPPESVDSEKLRMLLCRRSEAWASW